METLTDRARNGLVESPDLTVSEVRERVALARAGLEALHGLASAKRREAETLDSQILELESVLTGRAPELDPEPVQANGQHQAIEVHLEAAPEAQGLPGDRDAPAGMMPAPGGSLGNDPSEWADLFAAREAELAQEMPELQAKNAAAFDAITKAGRYAVDEAWVKLQNEEDRALIDACHRVLGSSARWRKLQSQPSGVSHGALRTAIGEEFRGSGGRYGPGMMGYAVRGGCDPCIEFRPSLGGKIVKLAGMPLLRRVYAALRITEASRVPGREKPKVTREAPKNQTAKPAPKPGPSSQSSEEKLRQALDLKHPSWAKLQKDGAADDELLRAVGRAFERGQVKCKDTMGRKGPDWSCKGGLNPGFWITRSGIDSKKAPDLRGPSLVAGARAAADVAKAKGEDGGRRTEDGGKSGSNGATKSGGKVTIHKPVRKKIKMHVAPQAGWSPGSLKEAVVHLCGKSGSPAAYGVCSKCETLYPVRDNGHTCPECGHMVYVLYQAKLERFAFTAPAKPDESAQTLADISHGSAAPVNYDAALGPELRKALDLDHLMFGASGASCKKTARPMLRSPASSGTNGRSQGACTTARMGCQAIRSSVGVVPRFRLAIGSLGLRRTWKGRP